MWIYFAFNANLLKSFIDIHKFELTLSFNVFWSVLFEIWSFAIQLMVFSGDFMDPTPSIISDNHSITRVSCVHHAYPQIKCMTCVWLSIPFHFISNRSESMQLSGFQIQQLSLELLILRKSKQIRRNCLECNRREATITYMLCDKSCVTPFRFNCVYRYRWECIFKLRFSHNLRPAVGERTHLFASMFIAFN